MKFVDEARVFVAAGKGGDGAIAFLREKYRPFGGPAGGDGGRGGDVIFEVNEGLATLLDFKYTPRLVARDGEAGRGKQQYGHAGGDLVVRVPPGTLVFDEESGDLLADLVMPGARAIVAHGGMGGKGNMHFTTSTRRAPRIATPGGPAEVAGLRGPRATAAERGKTSRDPLRHVRKAREPRQVRAGRAVAAKARDPRLRPGLPQHAPSSVRATIGASPAALTGPFLQNELICER